MTKQAPPVLNWLTIWSCSSWKLLLKHLNEPLILKRKFFFGQISLNFLNSLNTGFNSNCDSTVSVTATSQTGKNIFCLSAWWKKIFKTHLHISENVINICVINGLSLSPAINKNVFLFFITWPTDYPQWPQILLHHFSWHKIRIGLRRANTNQIGSGHPYFQISYFTYYKNIVSGKNILYH